MDKLKANFDTFPKDRYGCIPLPFFEMALSSLPKDISAKSAELVNKKGSSSVTFEEFVTVCSQPSLRDIALSHTPGGSKAKKDSAFVQSLARATSQSAANGSTDTPKQPPQTPPNNHSPLDPDVAELLSEALHEYPGFTASQILRMAIVTLFESHKPFNTGEKFSKSSRIAKKDHVELARQREAKIKQVALQQVRTHTQKGVWTLEQEKALIECVEHCGERWHDVLVFDSQNGRQLTSKTTEDLRNKWTTLMQDLDTRLEKQQQKQDAQRQAQSLEKAFHLADLDDAFDVGGEASGFMNHLPKAPRKTEPVFKEVVRKESLKPSTLQSRSAQDAAADFRSETATIASSVTAPPSYDQTKFGAVDPPEIKDVFSNLGSDDWKSMVKGCDDILTLAKTKPAVVTPRLRRLLIALDPLANNLRSAVAKKAIATICALTAILKSAIGPHVHLVLEPLMQKFRETNVFLQSLANDGLQQVVLAVHPAEVVTQLLPYTTEKHADVRLAAVRFLYPAINILGPKVTTLGATKGKLKTALTNLVADASKEVRAEASRTLSLFNKLSGEQ